MRDGLSDQKQVTRIEPPTEEATAAGTEKTDADGLIAEHGGFDDGHDHGLTNLLADGLSTGALTGPDSRYTDDPVQALFYQKLVGGDGGKIPWQTWSLGTTGSPVTLTYSFLQTLPSSYTEKSEGWDPEKLFNLDPATFAVLNETQRSNIRLALDKISAACGVTFVEVQGNQKGDIQFALINPLRNVDSITGFVTYLPPHDPAQAMDMGNNIFLSNKFLGSSSLEPGTLGFQTVLHEVGHTLGLKHPFQTCVDGDLILNPKLDNRLNTVMSYNWSSGFNADDLGPFDKAALQALYGPSRVGTDRKDSMVVDETAGRATVIGGDDGEVVVGTFYENSLVGGAGSDVIVGRGWADTLTGGAGADRMYGNRGADLFYAGGDGDYIDGGGEYFVNNGSWEFQGYDVVDYSTISGPLVLRIHDPDATLGVHDAAASALWNDERVFSTVQTAQGIDVLVDVEILRGSAFGDIFVVEADSQNPLPYSARFDVLDGGDGTDIVILPFQFDQAAFFVLYDQKILIKNDTVGIRVTNIEAVRFADGVELDLGSLQERLGPGGGAFAADLADKIVLAGTLAPLLSDYEFGV